MGISKNRVFDKEAIQSLSAKTQILMNTADTVINEIYNELVSLSNTLAGLPFDVRDSALKDKVDSLKGTIRTEEFKEYSAEIKSRLKALSDKISTQDNKLGKDVAAVAIDMVTVTTKLNDLKELIPAGADSGTYEDFKKDYDKCVETWSEAKALMDQMKQELIDAILGGFTPGTVQSKDPVNLGTGNFIYEKEDMQFAGSPALTMTRFYNALDRESGKLGTGWRHSFEISLKMREDEVQLCLPDGKRFTYSKKKDGTFVSDKTIDRLVKVDRMYLFKKSDGVSYEFDENGTCLCYAEESGNRITYTVEDGLLRKVLRDSDGAFYEFHYNENGKLQSVSDSRDRCVSYEYGADGSLQKASRLAGGFFEYKYDEAGYISKVVSADGTSMVENFFDSQGRCTRQNFPDGGSMSFAYDDENACITLTERNGSVTKYYHDQYYHNNRIVYEDGEERFIYNRRGQCTYHKNQNGAVTRYSYDMKGNVTQIMDALGNKTNATYDAKNHLLSLKVNGHVKLKNEYNPKGELIKTVAADSSHYQLTYDENGRVTEVTQPDGSTLSFAYDKNGNLSQIIDENGAVTCYVYDSLNRVVEAMDGNRNKTSFTYDKADQITSVVNPAGNKRTYAYNQRGRVSKVVDFDGYSMEAAYNCLNRPESVTDKEGNVTKFEYDSMWNVSAKITPDGARTAYVYNRANRLEQVMLPNEGCIAYEYDAAGNQTGMTDAEGNHFAYEYDAVNHMIAMTEPDGAKTSYEYDAEDHVTSVTDAMGNVRYYAYDEMGRKISETDPLGNVTSYAYTVLGDIKEITYPNGAKTTYEYEPGGRLAKIIQPSGASISYQYDKNGNRISEKNNLGQGLEYQYDCMNQVTAVISSNGGIRRYEYDAVGNITKMTDENGNETKYAYSPNGNLVSVKDALGNETAYEYDEMSRLVKITRAGDGVNITPDQITQYQWNLEGKIESITDPLGSVEHYRYDKNGNVVEKTDRDGFTTKYAYNWAGNVTDILYADGKTVAFSYNALRQLQEMQDWLGTTKIELDALGRPLSVTDFRGKTVQYQWGSMGEKTKLVYPDGEETIYEYDGMGRLAKLIDDGNEITYEYDLLGRVAKKHLPNGVETEYSYNNIGRLERLKHTGRKGLELSYDFQYDLAGNKVLEKRKRSDYPADSGRYEYTYDKLSRLTAVVKDGQPVRKYVYDGFGNRVSKETYLGSAVMETVYRYNENNQLVSEADASMEKSYQYDYRGNLNRVMSGNELLQKFTFDAVNQMDSAASYMDGVIKKAQYGYNGLGKRVKQSTYESHAGVQEDALNPMKNIQYTLDLTRDYYNLLSQEDVLEQKKQRFMWDGNVAGMEEDGVNSYYLQDALGSVVNLVGKDGESMEQLAYEEFGQIRNRSVRRTVQPFAFTGYQMDETSGLYFAQARRYDAGAGRFVSEDKVRGFADVPVTLNHYGYCWNRPEDLVDLDGKLPTIVVCAIIGGVAGGVGSIVSDVYHGRDINWKEAGINTLKGAAGGAAIGTGVGAISYLAESAGVATTVVSTMKTGAAIGQGISSGVNVAYQATSKDEKIDMGEVTISGAGGALSGMLMGSSCGYPGSILGNGAISGGQSVTMDAYTGNIENMKKNLIINSTIGALSGLYGGRGACYGQTYKATDIINIRFGIYNTKEYVIDPLVIKKAMQVSVLKTLGVAVFTPPISEFVADLQTVEKN